MNILIGANGSGKSNFINILNQFFKNTILDFTFDTEALEKKEKKSDYKNTISLLPSKTS
jgi:predicted ATPase